MRARLAGLALVLLGDAALAQDGPPPSPPERFSAGSSTINFGGPTISFGGQTIGYSAPSIEFPAPRVLTDEEKAFAPKPVAPPPAPPVEGLAITEEADGGVRYTLSADILFDFDKATLRPAAAAALDTLSEDVRKRFPKPLFVVEGHTDAKGSDSYNTKLSARRAETVKGYLVDREGFAAGGVSTAALGESRPVASNTMPDGSDDPEGRQKNRRVEIVVRPES